MNRVAFAILWISACPPSAWAWNALGHKVVAEIAWRELSAEDREAIVDVLRRHPRFDADFAGKMEDDAQRGDKAVQDRWIFLHAATWPDVARGLPAGERSKYDRPTWHYINLPYFLDAADRRTLAGTLKVNLASRYTPRDDESKLNVLQAVGYCQYVLRQRHAGPDAKALAYCWLFHLVGDIHQPLHSTALFSAQQFPEGDRGGNEIPLTRGKNLHSLWDNLLGRQHYLRNVDKAHGELTSHAAFRDVWQSARRETDPRKWAAESHELCKAFVYSDEILSAVRHASHKEKLEPVSLPDAYMKEAGFYARQRIITGGVRLAVVLRSLRLLRGTHDRLPINSDKKEP